MYVITIMYFGSTERYECDNETATLEIYNRLIEARRYNVEVLCEIHFNGFIRKHYDRIRSESEEILCG